MAGANGSNAAAIGAWLLISDVNGASRLRTPAPLNPTVDTAINRQALIIEPTTKLLSGIILPNICVMAIIANKSATLVKEAIFIFFIISLSNVFLIYYEVIIPYSNF
jgi:hypothetical protein